MIRQGWQRAGWVGLALIWATGLPAQSEAGIINLGTANAYNVFSLGDDTQGGVDAHGRVAVGGNAYFGGPMNPGGYGYTIASKRPTGSTVNLVVGGNYSNSSHEINGSVVVGGNATIANPTIHGNLAVNGNLTLDQSGKIDGNVTYGAGYANPNTTINGKVAQGTTTLPVDFASEKTYLTSLSNALASAGSTGTISFNGNSATGAKGQFFLTGSDDTANVFNIRGSDLALTNAFYINAKAGSTAVINVDGADDLMGSFDFFYTGIDKQHVLFNFASASKLTLNAIGVKGSILAANAAVTFTNGNIDGSLVVGSVTGNGESHDFLFQGDLSRIVGPNFNPNVQPSTVPEPASMALVLVGLGLTGAVRRRAG